LAKFFDKIYFVNTKFAARTMFDRTDFGSHVPDFRGATMHDATEWHGARWPEPPRDSKTAQARSRRDTALPHRPCAAQPIPHEVIT
jgi:hypothetical protein